MYSVRARTMNVLVEVNISKPLQLSFVSVSVWSDSQTELLKCVSGMSSNRIWAMLHRSLLPTDAPVKASQGAAPGLLQL